VYSELNQRFSSSIPTYLSLGFQALLPLFFVRLALEKFVSGVRLNNKKVIVGSYLLFFLIIYAFFSVFKALFHFSHPDIYALTLTSLLTLIFVLAIIIKNKSWNNKHAFGMLLLFMVLSVSFIYSAFQRADGISLAVANILFIAKLVVLVKQDWKLEKNETPKSLNDFNLTKRQQQVATLILEGRSFGQIAKQLNIAESTASKHGSDIYAKTGCQDRTSFFKKFHASFEASRLNDANQQISTP